MYKKYYRCRLCGEIVKIELRKETYESIDIKILNDSKFIRNETHFCDDKNIGILEFLGVKEERDTTKGDLTKRSFWCIITT